MGIYVYKIQNKPVAAVLPTGEHVDVYPLVYSFKPWGEFWDYLSYGRHGLFQKDASVMKQIRGYEAMIRNFEKIKDKVRFVAVADRNGKIYNCSEVYRVKSDFVGVWFDSDGLGDVVGFIVNTPHSILKRKDPHMICTRYYSRVRDDSVPSKYREYRLENGHIVHSEPTTEVDFTHVYSN